MAVQEIDVYIDKNGQVRVEVRGIPGPACLAVTAPLERALGGQVVGREMTSEATLQPEADVNRQQQST